MVGTVSVIIPNYNRAPIIAEVIDNILSQTLSPKEIIIVDDGSTDNSIEVIERFRDKVKLIAQPNKGPGAARNAGLKIASGDYIQFMDSDDLSSLNKLEVQTATLEFTKADIVYGPWMKVWLINHSVRTMDVVLQQKALPPNHSALHWFLTEWSMIFQQCLIRRALLQKVGGFREDIYFYEDGNLFVRLLLAGAKMCYENQTLTLYRLNDFGKLTATGGANTRRALDQARYYQEILEMAKEDAFLRATISHYRFRLNVFNAVKDLYKTGGLDESAHASLITFVRKSKWLSDFQLLLIRKQAGIRKQVQGHRWSRSYRAGKMTKHQLQLISSLGLTVSN